MHFWPNRVRFNHFIIILVKFTLKSEVVYAFFQMRKFFAMVKETTGKDNASKERRLTMMMFSVVALFLISNTMRHVCLILFVEKVISFDTMTILGPFYTFLCVINSSVNIFFYTYFNTSFRQNLIALFDCVRLPCFKTKPKSQGQPISLNLISKTQVTDISTNSTSGKI